MSYFDKIKFADFNVLNVSCLVQDKSVLLSCLTSCPTAARGSAFLRRKTLHLSKTPRRGLYKAYYFYIYFYNIVVLMSYIVIESFVLKGFRARHEYFTHVLNVLFCSLGLTNINKTLKFTTL